MKCFSFISDQKVAVLQQNFFDISCDITSEFQRKIFSFLDIKNWKATQFIFFLLYGGAIVLKNALNPDQYRHFLILYSSCRILSSNALATSKADYVKKLLETFFELMPHFYGPNSQTMNFHNLIHIADDVANIGAPISQFSAFDFENSLGYIKAIVKSPNNPIAQINRKLHIFHNQNSANKIPLVYPLYRNTKYSLGKLSESSESKVTFSFINIKGFKFTSSHPDNVCLLSNGNIFVINEIFSKKQNNFKCDDIFLNGFIFNEITNFFEYPLSSKEIGLYNVRNLSTNLFKISINVVEVKCILTTFQNETIAITLLHQ